jgi:DNA-binding transcriptional LysR family regulator
LAEVSREPLVIYSRVEYPEAHEELAKMFAHVKAKPHIAGEHDGVASLIAGVESGAGVALVPESIACIAGPRLKLVRVTPPLPPLIIGAAWPKTGLTPTAERFLKCAKEVVIER